jgi:aminotransferase
VLLPLREEEQYRVDPAALRAKLSKRTKAIILNSPMNPTGMVVPEGTIRAIAEAIAGTRIFLISDEAYERVLYDGRRHFSPGCIEEIRSQVVSVFSFSKTYAMTGWRIGYMTGPRALLTEVAKVHLAITGYVNSIAQKAALAALECEEEVRRMADEYARRRQIVQRTVEKLSGISAHSPEGAFYYFLKLRNGMSDFEAARLLIREAGVVLTPGSIFGPSGAGHLRLSYAAPSETLQAAMDRVQRVLGREAA